MDLSINDFLFCQEPIIINGLLVLSVPVCLNDLLTYSFMLLVVDENRNYIDDYCLGKLLQAMCYRCLKKKKDAMECLRNAFNR